MSHEIQGPPIQCGPDRRRSSHDMKRLLALLAAIVALVLASASIALAASPSSGHGSTVSTAAHATYASGNDRGAAVSALAKSHGLEVSTAAKAKHDTTLSLIHI